MGCSRVGHIDIAVSGDILMVLHQRVSLWWNGLHARLVPRELEFDSCLVRVVAVLWHSGTYVVLGVI